MAVTIREVARLAGVSQATAARALSGYGAVSERARAKVAYAAEQLGYRPNRVAQALRLGYSHYIGFVPGDIENPFFATVARALTDALEQHGYTVLVSSSGERNDRERRIVETLRTHLVSGLVVAPAFGYDHTHLAALRSSGVPLVVIDRPVEGLAADTVTVDNTGAARAAVDHLFDLGHTRIGFLGDNLQIAPSVHRLDGYRAAYAARHLLVDDAWVALAAPSGEGAYKAAAELLRSRPQVTAIFAGDNVMTLGVLRAAHDLDVQIPRDVGLVGFDDFDFMSAAKPTISAMVQPTADIGRHAAELLIARIEGSTAEWQHIVLPTSLVRRESSAAPRQTGPSSAGPSSRKHRLAKPESS